MRGVLTKERENGRIDLSDAQRYLYELEEELSKEYYLSLYRARKEKGKYGKASAQERLNLSMNVLMLKIVRQLKQTTAAYRKNGAAYEAMDKLERIASGLSKVELPSAGNAKSLLKSLSSAMEKLDSRGVRTADDINRLQAGAEELHLNEFVPAEEILLNNSEIDELIDGASLDEVLFRSTMDMPPSALEDSYDEILARLMQESGAAENAETADLFETEDVKDAVEDAETAAQEPKTQKDAVHGKSRKDLLNSL